MDKYVSSPGNECTVYKLKDGGQLEVDWSIEFETLPAEYAVRLNQESGTTWTHGEIFRYLKLNGIPNENYHCSEDDEDEDEDDEESGEDLGVMKNFEEGI